LPTLSLAEKDVTGEGENSMTQALRRIDHGGPADPDRVEGIAGTGEEFSFRLAEGKTFLEAVTMPLLERGFQSAAFRIVDTIWEPLVYALPALAEETGRVFRYSDPITAKGGARTEMAQAIFGRRDEAPFTHCHGIWIEGDGRTRGGHVLPEKTIVVKGGEARGIGLKDVAIRADLDLETGFTLFHPVAVPGVRTNPGRSRAVAARVKPNVDISEAVEGLCRQHGFARAELYGGIGNLNGAIFDDGSIVPDIGSESMILSGSVSSGANGAPVARLHIAFVGLDGIVHRGTLVRSRNPVAVTFEFILQEIRVHTPGEMSRPAATQRVPEVTTGPDCASRSVPLGPTTR
jgi:predicted DNA-binding protein with PD1-like motif